MGQSMVRQYGVFTTAGVLPHIVTGGREGRHIVTGREGQGVKTYRARRRKGGSRREGIL